MSTISSVLAKDFLFDCAPSIDFVSCSLLLLFSFLVIFVTLEQAHVVIGCEFISIIVSDCWLQFLELLKIFSEVFIFVL